MKKISQNNLLIIFCTVLFVAGCNIIADSDDNPGDPPELPKLEIYQPDFNFFSNQGIQKQLQELTGYDLASELIYTEVEPFIQGIHTYLLFIDPAREYEPEFREGAWEWHYTYSLGEDSFNIRLTAEENTEGNLYYKWTLYITSSSDQDQQSLNNYKLMEFSTSPEYTDGSFFIYPIEYQDPEISFLLYWSLPEDLNHELHFVFRNSMNSTEEINVLYTRDVAAHVLEMDYASGEHYIIYWNADTNEGFVNQIQDSQSTDQMICWDGNLNDTEC